MSLTAELRRDAADQRRRWRYRVHQGRVRFDHEVRRAHRRLRQSLPAYLRGANYFSVVTAPVIYSLLLPMVLLDVWVSMYQWICFPIYGVARVRRRRYFPLDRHRLEYLNAIEKANCTFCTYANGVVGYVREVAARTEQVPGARSVTLGRWPRPIPGIASSSTTATPSAITASWCRSGGPCSRRPPAAGRASLGDDGDDLDFEQEVRVGQARHLHQRARW